MKFDNSARRTDAWKPEDDAMIVEMRENFQQWQVIAAKVGRTVNSCCSRYRYLIPAERRRRFVTQNRWAPEEEAVIKRLIAEGKKPRHIAKYMGKPIEVIYSKLQTLRQPARTTSIELEPKRTVPAHLIEERDRRQLQERDITAEFFGDPRRGQSALDKKMGVFA